MNVHILLVESSVMFHHQTGKSSVNPVLFAGNEKIAFKLKIEHLPFANWFFDSINNVIETYDQLNCCMIITIWRCIKAL